MKRCMECGCVIEKGKNKCSKCYLDKSLETKGYAQSGNPSDIQKSVQSPDTNSLEEVESSSLKGESIPDDFNSNSEGESNSGEVSLVTIKNSKTPSTKPAPSETFVLSNRIYADGTRLLVEDVKEFIRLLKKESHIDFGRDFMLINYSRFKKLAGDELI